jgi:hypothetical protein
MTLPALAPDVHLDRLWAGVAGLIVSTDACGATGYCHCRHVETLWNCCPHRKELALLILQADEIDGDAEC